MTDPRAPASGRSMPLVPPVVAEVAKARQALAANRLQEAEYALRERLHYAPTDVAAIHLLGELATKVGRLADAEELFAEAVRIAPTFATARYALAVTLHRQTKSVAALDHALALRSTQPAEPLYRALEAALRASLGDHAQSLALYEALFAEGKDGPRLRLSYGHGLKTMGRAAESVAAYRRLTGSAHPEDKPLWGEAWWSLANLKTERLGEADRAAMRRALADAAVPQDGQAHLHYALGKALEDEGDAEGAFAHYAAGAAIRRRQSPHDASRLTARVEATIATLTPELLARHAGQGAPGRDPIFVVGLPRSGSTLIEQILASHPSIEGTMELVELPALARGVGLEGANADPAALARLTANELRRLGDAYLAATRAYRKTDRPFFVDKLPNNWIHAGLIRLILSQATIIDVRRSPLAGCVSAFRQLFARGQAFSYDLGDLGRYYRDYVAMMDHVDRIAPGAVHRVIYEDLIEDPEPVVRALLDHVGVPFDPACLAFHETKRPVTTPSAEQVRQPLYREGLDQWRAFDQHLGRLKDALGPALASWRGVSA